MTTDWASLKAPSLRERAEAAFQKRLNDRYMAWEYEVGELIDAAESFIYNKLLFSEDEISDFRNNNLVSDYDYKKENQRPYITWETDNINLKFNFVLEEVAVIAKESGTKSERINESRLAVMVEGLRGWKRINSLADLGEVLSK